jgi:hypothetical protein
MSETTIGVIGVIVVLGILIGVAWALDRRSKTKGNLFTGKPTRTMRIIAFLLGLIFGGIFIGELLGSERVHLLPPILAVAALGYSFGAEKLMRILQK